MSSGFAGEISEERRWSERGICELNKSGIAGAISA